METLLQAGVRPASPMLLRGFSAVARSRVRGSFRAVRTLHAERLSAVTSGPLIVYLNHPSWWDPLLCLLAAQSLLPMRDHYAPISDASLQRYRIFGKLGMFPVEQNSPRGAAQFLRASRAVLDAGGVLWVTAQGRFTDARQRPLTLKPGLGALVSRLDVVTLVPLAVEYTFWNQRLPEALFACGEPLAIHGAMHSAQKWTAALETHLQNTQEELASASLRRDPSVFQTLLEGNRGTAGFYGAWQRLQTKLTGKPYESDHAEDIH